MKPMTRNILILGAVVILAAVLASIYLFNKKHPDLSQVEPDYILTATELFNDFTMDEAAANEKYNGEVLEVSGNVASLENSGDTIMNVILMDDEQFAGVVCTFRKTEGGFKDSPAPGEMAKIRGICSGMLMDVLLNNCVFVEK